MVSPNHQPLINTNLTFYIYIYISTFLGCLLVFFLPSNHTIMCDVWLGNHHSQLASR